MDNSRNVYSTAKEEYEHEYEGKTVLFGKDQSAKVVGYIYGCTMHVSREGHVPLPGERIVWLKIEYNNSIYKLDPEKITAIEASVDKCPHCGKALPGKD